jgi:SAM-dependent methyltransferase
MTEQSIQAKQGEIEFRRTLSEQELGREYHLPEVFSHDEIMPVIERAIKETRRDFKRLAARGVPLSPFLEIGAERGHRSFVLRNEFDAWGFAFDLSLDALQFGERLMVEFGFADAPVRICGDAYHLPFCSDVLPFVCVFATLHHVPDPLPLVGEVRRVLQDGGYFYFTGEPTRGLLSMDLWTRRGYKLSKLETWLNRLGILGMISDGGGLEREYGILENRFPLKKWIQIARLFDRAEMQVNQTLKIRFDLARSTFKQHVAAIVGGVTSGLCQVRKPAPPLVTTDWIEMLRCPTCAAETDVEHPLRQQPTTQALYCDHCHSIYPYYNGVYLIMPSELRQALYPVWRPVEKELSEVNGKER